MNIIDLKTQIKTNKLDSLYLFTGEEWKVMQIYINEMIKTKGLIKENCDNLDEIIVSLKAGKSLYTKPKCYVVRDEYNHIDNLDKIKELLSDNMLILIYTSVDKRSKLYKQFKDTLIEFNKLNEQTLTNYIKSLISLNIANIHTLIIVCDYDYGRILSEIDKIKQFGGNPDDTFCHLLQTGVIYMPPKDAVFQLVDAVLTRQPKLAYELFDDCKRIGEANLVIITNLFNMTKQVLQVQSYRGEDICKATGLTSWQVRNAQQKCGYWSVRELINIMRLAQRVEIGIKSGIYEDSISVDYILEEIFTKGVKHE